MAELTGKTMMAMTTLTSPGTGTPLEASRPSKPMGNQQRKSDTAMVTRRRAMVRSLDFLVESPAVRVLVRMDQ